MKKESEFALFSEASRHRLAILSRREAAQLKVFVGAALEREYEIMLDIGANIGAYSCVVARRCPSTIIHAFEAVPGTHAELLLNIERQGFSDQILAHSVALSSEPGTVDFLDLGPLAGASAIASTANLTRGEHITVEAKKLDDIVKNKGQSALMKIDVEGHELSVLAGAEEFLVNNQCLIQVEFLTPTCAKLCRDFLDATGYEEALHIHNDHYFVTKGDSELREKLRNLAFDAVSDEMEEYYALADYAGRLNKQVLNYKRDHPEADIFFPKIPFPTGGWVS